MTAAIGSLGACASTSTPETKPAAAAPTGGAALQGAEWTVFEIAGKPIVPGSTPSIKFEDGRVSGAGSCNRFMGGYTIAPDGLKLTFSQMASTMMACPDPLMQQEGLFLKSLESVASYSVAGGVLSLSSADGVVVKAKR
ncbi:META domain-containing protein [Sandaracinobacter neustonicus]|uniref:META domain-containing protein n=1 Tax=Sandaracinobacter neustonicus TaxID=1715348 RepID=A0A501XF74_9SPHN|nr:META domain-containing protein [Sandaracinobacter neustonicus]TPE59176.1 META domain-containing protein [Sandaracinobacter neustonicus]